MSGKGDLYYAREKLSLAIRTLAVTHGTLQERLLDGWMSNGHLSLPMGKGQAGLPMSVELVERLEEFNSRMSARPAIQDEGTFTSTILRFSDDEASEAAKELLDIHYQVEAEIADHKG